MGQDALRKEKHASHYNLEEALKIIDFVKPEQAYLTHISHLMGFHENLEDELTEGVNTAYDGLKIKL